jgi:SAM-dependent methyltransferase
MDLIRRAVGRSAARPAPPTPGAPATTPKPTPELLPKDDLHEFWRDPDQTNRPERYLEHSGRSAILAEFIRPYVTPDASILEIGCNVGRNLAWLHHEGYRRLTGIEINAEALAVLRETYPDLASTARLINAPVEDAITELADDSIDLVFTMAVLEHIHPDSEWIFDHIVRVARSTVITIEDERHVSQRHVPRDYREVFTSRGMREVAHLGLGKEMGFGGPYEARAFKKAGGG